MRPRRRRSRPDPHDRAVEDSLRRLRTDHLDLLYVHQRDGQTPAARDRITQASQLPAYYPLWHRLLNGQDRPEPAEAEFCAEQREHVIGADQAEG